MAKQAKSVRKVLNPVFHLQTAKEDDCQLSKALVKNARKTGTLKLSNRNLATVPERLWTMYERNENEPDTIFNLNSSPEEPWWSYKSLTSLDLSSNCLQEIPGRIEMFGDLEILNLQDNCLQILPNEIKALTKLTKLNLSHNKINYLPNGLYELQNLLSLQLSYNELEKINEYMGDLVMLQKLDMSHNKLTILPPGLGYLIRLTEINLSYNQLTELPLDIVNLRALIKLDVTYNELVKLPALGELRKLKFLYAQHNNIEEMPDFAGCEALEEIYLGNNYIKSFSDDFCENLPHIKILDIRDNKLEVLPEEISMLQHLIRLDLTNNELTVLPNSLGLLAHLQNLQLEGNKFRQLRREILKSGTARILKLLREKMDSDEKSNPAAINGASNPDLGKFPDKHAIRKANGLSLVMKELTDVPDSVFEEAIKAEVSVVDLCKNKLTEVPNGLKIMTHNVTELNLSLNKLKAVPDFISECINLHYLELSGNRLKNLPQSLECLLKLREIVISNNCFTSIPTCLYEMEGLEILLARDNQIIDIDVDGLKKLKRLATLDLANNNINHVPPELGNLTQLRCLELVGNSFRQPRFAILQQGTHAILSYLRDRIPS